jgi:hypothetical protein
MKKIFISTIVLALIFSGCTDEFVDANTNPYQISDESLRQDNNHVGAFFPTMLDGIIGDQIHHNLANDSFVRHLGTPTPFVGGINNTTYYIRWNPYWGRVYNNIFKPSAAVIDIAEEEGNVVFVSWAKLIRLYAASRLTALFGPIIYSDFGSTSSVINYDSEEELYDIWFSELDEIVATLTANSEFGGMSAFDASYGGNINNWIKFANSLRLRLAIRISKVDPVLAQAQAEKAMSAAGGLITTNADNLMVSLYGHVYYEDRICFGWGDTRMSASMESILGGYNDPRIAKYFDPAADNTLYPDHPTSPYKGIRNGATLGSKSDRLEYSTISSDFKTVSNRRLYTAAETHLNIAEAALRGWNTNGLGTAGEAYEAGVRASFSDWGAGGVDTYLADDTALPFDYDDPKAAGAINDFVNRITTTVKWDDAATNEVKLEKIITQKWIAAYTNTVECWVDQRRTGYPKLPFNYQNDSDATWGVIAADDFIRRMPFVDAERNGNPDGVAGATTKLGGPDEIGTHLWWDTNGGFPNTNF